MPPKPQKRKTPEKAVKAKAAASHTARAAAPAAAAAAAAKPQPKERAKPAALVDTPAQIKATAAASSASASSLSLSAPAAASVAVSSKSKAKSKAAPVRVLDHAAVATLREAGGVPDGVWTLPSPPGRSFRDKSDETNHFTFCGTFEVSSKKQQEHPDLLRAGVHTTTLTANVITDRRRFKEEGTLTVMLYEGPPTAAASKNDKLTLWIKDKPFPRGQMLAAKPKVASIPKVRMGLMVLPSPGEGAGALFILSTNRHKGTEMQEMLMEIASSVPGGQRGVEFDEFTMEVGAALIQSALQITLKCKSQGILPRGFNDSPRVVRGADGIVESIFFDMDFVNVIPVPKETDAQRKATMDVFARFEKRKERAEAKAVQLRRPSTFKAVDAAATPIKKKEQSAAVKAPTPAPAAAAASSSAAAAPTAAPTAWSIGEPGRFVFVLLVYIVTFLHTNLALIDLKAFNTLMADELAIACADKKIDGQRHFFGNKLTEQVSIISAQIYHAPTFTIAITLLSELLEHRGSEQPLVYPVTIDEMTGLPITVSKTVSTPNIKFSAKKKGPQTPNTPGINAAIQRRRMNRKRTVVGGNNEPTEVDSSDDEAPVTDIDAVLMPSAIVSRAIDFGAIDEGDSGDEEAADNPVTPNKKPKTSLKKEDEMEDNDVE